jgi:hypothetical protein
MKSLSFLKGVNSVEKETLTGLVCAFGKKAEFDGPFYKYPISFYLILNNPKNYEISNRNHKRTPKETLNKVIRYEY